MGNNQEIEESRVTINVLTIPLAELVEVDKFRFDGENGNMNNLAKRKG